MTRRSRLRGLSPVRLAELSLAVALLLWAGVLVIDGDSDETHGGQDRQLLATPSELVPATVASSAPDSTLARPTGTATLRVIAVVVNDNGGTKETSDFSVFVDSTLVVSGGTIALEPGTHRVTQRSDEGYAVTIGGDCGPEGTIVLDSTEEKTCALTYDDEPATIRVIANDNGGLKPQVDTRLFVDEAPVDPGKDFTVPAGSYRVHGVQDSAYVETVGGDCAADGRIVLGPGDHKTCTVTINIKTPR